MKGILEGINRLAAEELERANKAHPLFHSDHEGFAVIAEEMEEAEEHDEAIMEYEKSAWEAIRQDNPMEAADAIAAMRVSLSYAASEMIQVIAMCDKFIASQEARE